MKWLGWAGATLAVVLSACGGGGGVAVNSLPSGPYITSQYAPSQVSRTTNIVYSRRPNAGGVQSTSDINRTSEAGTSELAMALDIWVPPNATASSPQPLIIHIHAGGFSTGAKEDLASSAMSYAQAGYVAASINYRLTPNNEDSVELRTTAVGQASEDLMNAIRYLKVNAALYHIDPNRIATIGFSAGGGMSMINAVEYDTLFDTVSDYPGVSARVNAAISTGATLTNTEGYDSDTFLHYDATDTPVMLFHANPTDVSTGATWTGNVIPTQQRIVASGNTCTLVSQPNLTHTVDLSVGSDYWGTLQPFLNTQLRLWQL